MKIQPVLKKSRILPAALALLATSQAACFDKQRLSGDVPNPNPPQEKPTDKQERPEDTAPAPETSPEEEPEEIPQILGGDVPAENCNQDN